MVEVVQHVKDWNALWAWRRSLHGMEPTERLRSILNRYPRGSTVDAIQTYMGLGRGRAARRKLDRMLRELETKGEARFMRAGEDGRVRMWGKASPPE